MTDLAVDVEARGTPMEEINSLKGVAEAWVGDDRTIHQRMAAILAELPAIPKESWNDQQKFHYRSNDDVLNALNPLLAKHGVYMIPDAVERVATTERKTNAGKTMYEVNLHVRFRFYGLTGDYVEASGWGEGTDMGDKATNKAMTGALKYVIAAVFAISTAENADPDGESPEDTTAGQGTSGERAAAQHVDGRAGPKDQPTSFGEIKQWIEGGYGALAWGDFQVFMQDAAEVVYGKREALAEPEKNRMGALSAMAVGWLYEAVPPGGAVPPSRDQVREAWAKTLDGALTSSNVKLEKPLLPGPLYRMGPDETNLPERGAESSFKAPEAEPQGEGSTAG